MLSKANRLSIKEFDLVVKTGREVHSPFFSMRYVPGDALKFSPTAPKKTFKTAVERNRTRRRIYGAARTIFKAKKIKTSLIVLIIKKDISDIDSPSLVRMLDDLFVQARLIA